MIMRMLVGVGMPMRVAVRMRVSDAIRMGVAVFIRMRVMVLMLVAMGVVGMFVRLVRMQILDSFVALAATAGAAHHTTSISLSRISSPP
jgi:hypothetical protein